MLRYECIVTIETCGSLSLTNGQVNYNELPLTSGGYPVGTVASFSCDHGFYLSSIISTTCDVSGTWSQNHPRCIQCNENIIDNS